MASGQCPICRYDFVSVESRDLGNWLVSDCPKCGKFKISRNAATRHGLTIQDIPQIELDALCHSVKSLTRKSKNETLRIDDDLLLLLKREARIKNPQEQLDLLVLWLGDVPDPSAWHDDPNPSEILSVVGAQQNVHMLHILFHNAVSRDLVDPRIQMHSGGVSQVRLSLTGWERFGALQNQVAESKSAFMAMKFNEDLVRRAFEECFKPAAEDAGFRLSIATETQSAGLIDDQMRVAIRTSRFVVADLSDGNKGAYWEAGFAEGLGKPVIYTCRKDVWDNSETQPHFDTNHMVTVLWSPQTLDAARAKMAATIRNTFPTEAKMSNED